MQKLLLSLQLPLTFLIKNTCAQSCADGICLNNPEDCMDLGPGMSICFCSEGYTGETCEILINDPCENSPCQNSGTCVVESGTDFSCICADGFMGSDCGIDIDECATEPCLNGGSCVDGVNGFSCECAEGYFGFDCATAMNPCATFPCENGGACERNAPNSPDYKKCAKN